MLKTREALNISCGNCNSAHLCLARTLNEEEKRKLDTIITKTEIIEKGEHLYRQNGKMANFFAVYSGYGKEYVLDKDGNEKISNFIFPGDITGLQDVPFGKHSGSFLALTRLTVCLIPVSALFSLMSVTPNLLKRFIYINSYKMQHDTHISHTTNAKRRVADFLLTTLLRFQERKIAQGKIPLVMSQFDIGNYLGIAYETISRILHDLQNQKVIHMENKEIHILNLRQLQSMGSSTENYGQAEVT